MGRGRWAALVAALLIGGACAVGPGDEDGGDQPEQQPGPQDSQAAVDDFRADAEGAVAVADDYWREKLTELGVRFQPIGDVITYQSDGEVDCGGQEIPRNNAVYCPAGDFIAYDVNFAVSAFQQVGDAFLFYLLGHEYAHAIQQRLGISHRLTIDHELQADCMAGAYIGDSVRAERLTLADGDLDEFQNGLLAVGDDPSIPWFAPGAHGTAEQRTEAFFLGYERSLDACGLS
jgi:uncharacterized protein